MASSKEYLDFVLEQLSKLDEITYKAMMGEYIIYYRGKIVGGIYDDRFLVKPTKSAKNMMPGADMERQLAATLRLLSQKAIHGVIFHCTPLVDMDLDAVDVSRAWIRENAAKKWGA